MNILIQFKGQLCKHLLHVDAVLIVDLDGRQYPESAVPRRVHQKGSLLGQLNSSTPSRTVPGMRHARADGETEFLVKLLWHRRTKGVATDSLYHTGPNLDSTESTESIR